MINPQILFVVIYLACFVICVWLFGVGGALLAVTALVCFYATIWKN